MDRQADRETDRHLVGQKDIDTDERANILANKKTVKEAWWAIGMSSASGGVSAKRRKLPKVLNNYF